MVNIKISELDELQKATDQDLLVIVDVANNNTKKIQAGNLGILVPKTTKTTSDTETYSCNYINKITEKNILSAYNTSDGSEVTEYGNTYLTLDSSVSTGSKLSLVDGKVKIGAGVSKIMISGLVRYYYKNNSSTTDYELGAYIYKNSSPVVSCRRTVHKSEINISDTIALTPRIITAKENDLISLVFYSTTGQITRKYLSESYLTVEVVE